MILFLNKFKIPTLVGLSIIITGIVAGVFIILRGQTFLSQASPNLAPQNVTLTNIDEQSLTISWQTSEALASFVTFGQGSPSEQTALDDRDAITPKPRLIHYVTIKNLQPKTTYLLKIVSGKFSSDTIKFTTANSPSTQNGFPPVIGSVLDGNKPLEDGVVYLSISQAIPQSALVKNLGNFLIPLSFIRKDDLSDTYQLSDSDMAKLTVISDKGQTTALFKLKSSGQVLPPIKLGQNVDLTNPEVSPSPTPTTQELNKYDLNEDGQINANDHAIVLQNFGKSPKNKKADLDGDGEVTKKDLDLIAKKINQ